MAGRAALLALGVVAAAAVAPTRLELPDVSTLVSESIYFLPLANELCGEGNPMYYGIVTPKRINYTKRVYIESMGGAVCFNDESCRDREYNVWLDLLKTVQRYIGGQIPPAFGTVDNLFGVLTSGAPIPLSMFRQFQVGYFPNGVGGPLDGEVGFFYPSCTGDGGIGNYHVTYSGSTSLIRHSGGASYLVLLQAIQRAYPDAERVTLIGASGSAVSRVAWAPTVADMFPAAKVLVLADSAMHVLPASTVYTYFWNEVQWSPNPGGRHDLATLYATSMESLPVFDWRRPSAISDMLRHYRARVKLLYIACNHDHIVVQDRGFLSRYANLSVATSKEQIAREMWEFLRRITRDAPAGSVFSYISEGSCHHQTRGGRWQAAINPSDASDPGPEEFTRAFLKEESPARAHVWCCNETPSEPSFVELSSALRRVPLIASAVAVVSVVLVMQ